MTRTFPGAARSFLFAAFLAPCLFSQDMGSQRYVYVPDEEPPRLSAKERAELELLQTQIRMEELRVKQAELQLEKERQQLSQAKEQGEFEHRSHMAAGVLAVLVALLLLACLVVVTRAALPRPLGKGVVG